MRPIDDDERRARLARRHHLLPSAKTNDVAAIARDLVGLHASDPATVQLGAAARMKSPSFATIERALYDDRVALRMLGMRRTLFVVSADLAPVVHAGATRAVAANERKKLVQLLEEAGITKNAPRWLRKVEAATLAALEERGDAVAQELSKDVPELAIQISFGEGKKWAGTLGVSTRVLLVLAAEGHIARGRPRGTWMSGQHRWVPMTSWLAGSGATGVIDIDALATDDAQAMLVEHWLRGFGPGTAGDIKWWTGWTARNVTRALTAVGAVEVELDGGAIGYVLPDDTAPVKAARTRWVALLPGLDSTTMGWQGREWYLGDHRAALFDTNGNAGPTVWCDGRVVGGWAQRKTGEIVIRLLEDVGKATSSAITAEAARLEALLGDARVTPRFRTPLERDLVS
jgi:hypothetical protein